MGGKGGTQTSTTQADPWKGIQPSLNNYYGMLNDMYFGPLGSGYRGGSGGYSSYGGGKATQAEIDRLSGNPSSYSQGSHSGGGFDASNYENTITPQTSNRWNSGANTQQANQQYFTPEAYGDRTGWMQRAQERIAPIDPNITKAWNMQEAQAGSGQNKGVLDLYNKTIAGDFLNSNPWADKIYGNIADQTQNRVNSAFSAAGRTGSGANIGTMTQELANAGNNFYGNLYNTERGLQQQAMGLAPTMNALQYADADMLGQIGNQRMAFAQNQLDAPIKALQQYGNLMAPGLGYGTQTTTQPYSSNVGTTLGGLIGMGAGAAAIPYIGLGGALPLMGLGMTGGSMLGSLTNRR